MGIAVSRSTGQYLTVNCQKRANFTVNHMHQKSSCYCRRDVKRFQGLSNLTISAAHLGLQIRIVSAL